MNDAVRAVDNWQRPSNSSAGFTTYRLNCVDVDVDVGRREEWKELIYVPTELTFSCCFILRPERIFCPINSIQVDVVEAEVRS